MGRQKDLSSERLTENSNYGTSFPKKSRIRSISIYMLNRLIKRRRNQNASQFSRLLECRNQLLKMDAVILDSIVLSLICPSYHESTESRNGLVKTNYCKINILICCDKVLRRELLVFFDFYKNLIVHFPRIPMLPGYNMVKIYELINFYGNSGHINEISSGDSEQFEEHYGEVYTENGSRLSGNTKRTLSENTNTGFNDTRRLKFPRCVNTIIVDNFNEAISGENILAVTSSLRTPSLPKSTIAITTGFPMCDIDDSVLASFDLVYCLAVSGTNDPLHCGCDVDDKGNSSTERIIKRLKISTHEESQTNLVDHANSPFGCQLKVDRNVIFSVLWFSVSLSLIDVSKEITLIIRSLLKLSILLTLIDGYKTVRMCHLLESTMMFLCQYSRSIFPIEDIVEMFEVQKENLNPRKLISEYVYFNTDDMETFVKECHSRVCQNMVECTYTRNESTNNKKNQKKKMGNDEDEPQKLNIEQIYNNDDKQHVPKNRKHLNKGSKRYEKLRLLLAEYISYLGKCNRKTILNFLIKEGLSEEESHGMIEAFNEEGLILRKGGWYFTQK